MVDLGLKTLLYDKVRFLITVSGVAFAVTLVLVQVGLFVGLLDNSTITIRKLDADLWVTSKNSPNLDFVHQFPESNLYRARSVPGVVHADNLILSFMQVSLPSGAEETAIVYAMQDFEHWGVPWQVTAGRLDDLKRGAFVMFDESASKRFGAFGVGDYREVNGQRLKVIGTSREAKSFTTTPLAFMDFRRAQELQPELLGGKTSYIVVKLAPGADVAAVQAELQRRLPYNDVFTSRAFKQRLKSHVSTLLLGSLLLGVAAHEWQQAKAGRVIASAEAKAKPAAPQNVLAEGRITVPVGAEITLGAELSGRLVRLTVKEQDRVKAGDVLGEIDVKEQQAALNEAWAHVKEAGADVDFTALERKRSEQLWRGNVVADASLDRSVHDSTAAESRRASLLAGAARISANISKAKLIAPIDGSVTQRFADAGEMVSAGAPIVTLTNLSQLRVDAEVGEFDAARVRLGAEVAIRAEGYEPSWRGKVVEIPDRVVPRALKPLDPSRPVDTRVLLIKIELSEAVPLKLGQRVEVEVSG